MVPSFLHPIFMSIIASTSEQQNSLYGSSAFLQADQLLRQQRRHYIVSRLFGTP
jgi:hypothetical protein